MQNLHHHLHIQDSGERKNKQRQGRACEKSSPPPPKPWGLHSRQGTGSAARTGLNPEVTPSQGSCFARAQPSRRLLLPRTPPTPMGGLSSFLSKLRQGINLDISSCWHRVCAARPTESPAARSRAQVWHRTSPEHTPERPLRPQEPHGAASRRPLQLHC